MYTVVKWPRNMALGEVVYISRRPNIVSLYIDPDPVGSNKNQEYNWCIHDWWAMIKDTYHTRHHII